MILKPRCVILICVLFCFAVSVVAVERPNIIWLIAEDLSPDLGCDGVKQVHTPNLDPFEITNSANEPAHARVLATSAPGSTPGSPRAETGADVPTRQRSSPLSSSTAAIQLRSTQPDMRD